MDYFTRLAQQALDADTAAVRPRLPGRFEPGGAPEQVPGSFEQLDAPAPVAPAPAGERSAAPIELPGPPAPAHAARTPAAEPGAAVARALAPMPAVEVQPARAPQAAAFEQPLATGRDVPAIIPSVAATIATSGTPDRTISKAQLDSNPVAGIATSSPRRAVAVAPALARPAPERTHAQADAAVSPPVIRVSIGRVEVRAVQRPAAPAPRPARAAQPAAAPLEDYLRANKGGRTR